MTMFIKRRRNRQRQNSAGVPGCDTSVSQKSSQSYSTRNSKPKASSLKSGSASGSHTSAVDSKGHLETSEGSAASGTASTRSSTATKRVRFADVQIREYERVLANNPSCSSGAPVGIGWSYAKEKKVPLDKYEGGKVYRRSQVELVLSRQERESILLEWGASFHDIVDAIRNNIKIKNQRRHTVNTLGRYDKWEEMMESAGRRIKRTILLKKTSSQQAKELSAQVQSLPLMVNAAKPPLETDAHHSNVTHQREHHHREHHHREHHHREHHQHASSESASEQRPTSPDDKDPQKVYRREDYGAGLLGPIVGDRLQPHIPAPLIDEELELRSVDSWGRPQIPAPIIELDIYEDEAEVHSIMSFEDDMTYETTDAYSDDGFGRLIRHTRHWYVGGLDGPRLQRIITPTVISEDLPYYGDQENWYGESDRYYGEQEALFYQVQMHDQYQQLLQQQPVPVMDHQLQYQEQQQLQYQEQQLLQYQEQQLLQYQEQQLLQYQEQQLQYQEQQWQYQEQQRQYQEQPRQYQGGYPAQCPPNSRAMTETWE